MTAHLYHGIIGRHSIDRVLNLSDIQVDGSSTGFAGIVENMERKSFDSKN